MSSSQVTRRLDPIHLRHYKIHQREMWHVKVKCRQSMIAVAGLPNDKPIRTLLQCRFESGPRISTVIDYEDTDQAHSSRCRSSRVVTVPTSLV